jgi:hypothetical protein
VKLTHEQLLNGEVNTTSIINEPLVPEEPKRESASARALRRWFKQTPEADTDD